jgi:hypothetical protein
MICTWMEQWSFIRHVEAAPRKPPPSAPQVSILEINHRENSTFLTHVVQIARDCVGHRAPMFRIIPCIRLDGIFLKGAFKFRYLQAEYR